MEDTRHIQDPRSLDVHADFHISLLGIDYESSLFQTLAYWKQHLVWTRAVDSWKPPEGTQHPVNSIYDVRLPDDIEQSLPPFDALKQDPNDNDLGKLSWSDVSLNYNVVTRQFPVVLHVTGNPQEKQFRQYWWPKMWFFHYAQVERLRLANLKLDQRQISADLIAGMHWFNAEGGDDAEEIDSGGKNGVWTDRRGWLSWKRVCKDVSDELYEASSSDAFHAPMVTAEPSAMPQAKGWAPFNWLAHEHELKAAD